MSQSKEEKIRRRKIKKRFKNESYTFVNGSGFIRSPMFSSFNEEKKKFCHRFIDDMFDTCNDLMDKLEQEKNRSDNEVIVDLQERIAMLEKELENKRVNDIYTINEQDRVQAYNWWQEHTEQDRKNWAAQKMPMPRMMHNEHYEIRSTGFSTHKIVVCSCGAELELGVE